MPRDDVSGAKLSSKRSPAESRPSPIEVNDLFLSNLWFEKSKISSPTSRLPCLRTTREILLCALTRILHISLIKAISAGEVHIPCTPHSRPTRLPSASQLQPCSCAHCSNLDVPTQRRRSAGALVPVAPVGTRKLQAVQAEMAKLPLSDGDCKENMEIFTFE